MSLQESGEMYLETILLLRKKTEGLHAIDIVNHTGYSKPSISRAIGVLKRDGYLTVDGVGHIELTKSGEERAIRTYERHSVLKKLLMSIGVDEKTAAEDACKIEHYISDITFEKIKEHANREN